MKVAFISSEVVPFAKTGGLADVCGALPLALESQKVPAIIIMPFHKIVDLKGYKKEELSRGVLRVDLSKKTKAYFVKAPKYFNRVGLYGSAQGDYEDNLERYHHFSRSAIEIIKAYENNNSNKKDVNSRPQNKDHVDNIKGEI